MGTRSARHRTAPRGRELERVAPSTDHAQLLLAQAADHLHAAQSLAEDHPVSAYTVLYDAARKAMTAALATQGLRPTNRNGHRAVQDALEAQLGRMGGIVRPFRELRLRRHDSEYPALDTAPVTSDEVAEALQDAAAIVDAMTKLVPRLEPF